MSNTGYFFFGGVFYFVIYGFFSTSRFTRPGRLFWARGFPPALGAIGSGLGGGLVAQASCDGISRQPLTVTPVTNVMLLGQAVTQTTAIYALLVSFILMFKSFPATDALAPPMALLAAGLCMGIGAIGPAIGEGFAGRRCCGMDCTESKTYCGFNKIMLVGQAVAESTGIYSLVIALVLFLLCERNRL